MDPKSISVIIPALNEENNIGGAIASASSGGPLEIIVVDGGSSDNTVEVSRGFESTTVLISPERGRAGQMNFGASMSKGEIILFLHADTILPEGWKGEVHSVMSDTGIMGGCFLVDLSRREFIYRLTCSVWNIKTRFFKIFTGDQAIFLRRDFFEGIGGFPPVPLMEDVLICDSIREGGAKATGKKVKISARYWEKWGPYRAILLMFYIKYLFRKGRSPEELRPYYREGKFPPFSIS